MEIDGGIMRYGFETAIVPLEPAESRRWHFLATEGRQITPIRAKNKLDKHGLGAKFKLADHYHTGKVYVGWCRKPLVTICTNAPDKFPANELFMASGVPRVRKLEEQSERSSSKDLSLLSRIGFLGSAVGISGVTKREKKYKQVSVVAKRTMDGNFEGVLTEARTTHAYCGMGGPREPGFCRQSRLWLLPHFGM